MINAKKRSPPSPSPKERGEKIPRSVAHRTAFWREALPRADYLFMFGVGCACVGALAGLCPAQPQVAFSAHLRQCLYSTVAGHSSANTPTQAQHTPSRSEWSAIFGLVSKIPARNG